MAHKTGGNSLDRVFTRLQGLYGIVHATDHTLVLAG